MRPPGYPVPVGYRSSNVAPYRNRPPPPPIFVQPNTRGATDENFLTPGQRVNRRKIKGGCYTFHDYVSRKKLLISSNEQICKLFALK
jgi:hypothetical protein